MKMEQTECSETSAYKIQTLFTYLPMKMEQTECSETSAYKIQTPGELPRRKHTKYKMCFDFLYSIWIKHLSLWEVL